LGQPGATTDRIADVVIMDLREASRFPRLLIAQAQDERLTLLTRDAAILALGLGWAVKG
jgi:PIN domain nuclease of toxin-antitoxin system